MFNLSEAGTHYLWRSPPEMALSSLPDLFSEDWKDNNILPSRCGAGSNVGHFGVYTEAHLLCITPGGALSLWVLLAFVNSEHRDGDI